jgi:hypothetical protein
MAIAFLSFGKSPEYEPILPISENEAIRSRSGSTSVPLSLSVTSATHGGGSQLSNRNSARDLTIDTAKNTIDEDVYNSTQRYEEMKYSDDNDKWKSKVSLNRQPSGRGCVGPTSTMGIFWKELKDGFKHVAFLVFPFYFWLLWRW